MRAEGLPVNCCPRETGRPFGVYKLPDCGNAVIVNRRAESGVTLSEPERLTLDAPLFGRIVSDETAVGLFVSSVRSSRRSLPGLKALLRL